MMPRYSQQPKTCSRCSVRPRVRPRVRLAPPPLSSAVCSSLSHQAAGTVPNPAGFKCATGTTVRAGLIPKVLSCILYASGSGSEFGELFFFFASVCARARCFVGGCVCDPSVREGCFVRACVYVCVRCFVCVFWKQPPIHLRKAKGRVYV